MLVLSLLVGVVFVVGCWLVLSLLVDVVLSGSIITHLSNRILGFFL